MKNLRIQISQFFLKNDNKIDYPNFHNRLKKKKRFYQSLGNPFSEIAKFQVIINTIYYSKHRINRN